MKFLTGRPVLAATFFITVLLMGFYSFQNIPLELMPDESLPKLTITASWPGASADLVMQRLSLPIEEEVMNIRGVSKITSHSMENRANIEVEFARGSDMDFVYVLLKERINNLREKLPPNVQLPRVTPYRPREFTKEDFMQVDLYGSELVHNIRNYAERELIPRLRGLPGIKNIALRGGQEVAVKIVADNERMKSLGIDFMQIMRKIGENFFNMVSITAVREAKEISISLTHPAASAQAIGDIVLALRGSRPVCLRDVADVAMGFREQTEEARYQGMPTVSLVMSKQPEYSTLKLARVIKERLAQLLARHRGSRVEYKITRDESEELSEYLKGLIWVSLLIMGIIFVILMIIVRDAKSALLIFTSVLFSVFFTFTFLYLFKIPMNKLTLAGFAVGFGMFVDNAVVVFDNILRLRQKGMNALQASIEGPRQVVMPVLSSTLTTIIVFFTFAYFQGRLRVYYLPVSLTVSLALVASMIVAFTLIPPLAARMNFRFKSLGSEGQGRFFEKLLQYPLFVIVPVILLIVYSGTLFFKKVSFGQFFSFYEKQRIQVGMELPQGSEFRDTREEILKFEKIALAKPYKKEINTFIQENYAQMLISFPKEIEFSAHPYALKQELIALATNLSRVQLYISGFDPESYFTPSSDFSFLPFQLQIKGYDYERLLKIAEEFKKSLLLHRRIQEVSIATDQGWFRSGGRYFHMTLDYDRMARIKVSPNIILWYMQSTLGRREADNKIRLREKEYDAEIRIRGSDEYELSDLLQKEFYTPEGTPFRLRDVVRVEERNLRGGILRKNQEFIAIVSWDYLASAKAGERYYKTVFKNLQLPPGFKKSEPERLSFIQQEEEQQMNTALVMAVLLVLLILLVLYNDVMQPLIIVLGAVPASAIGVFFAFVIAEFSFDTTARVGAIIMIGVVVNNAIILVNHINYFFRQRGFSLERAIAQGTYERIRPIFMTTATTVLGALPLVLVRTQGRTDVWTNLALCMVGGLTASAILIPFVVPVLYHRFWLFEQYVKRVFHRPAPKPD